jgi:hypothetical protein
MKIGELYVWIMRLFNGPRSWSSIGDATAKDIIRLASPCPACGERNLIGHKYGAFATMIAENNTQDIAGLLDLLQDRNWDMVARLDEFHGDKNAIIVYALLCKIGSGCVLAVRDPVDLHEPPWLLSTTIINEDETGCVRRLMRYENEILG